MSDEYLVIITKACIFRTRRGENLEDILAANKKLTKEDKAKIREAING
jgi:hypothetical protein